MLGLFLGPVPVSVTFALGTGLALQGEASAHG